MNQQGPKNVSESHSNRACDACRAHKVRCLPSNTSSSKTCQRCAKTDRQCIFTAPQKRKQRKRTDTRVAELEREVRAMRVLFDNKASVIQEEGGFEERSFSQSTPGLDSNGMPTTTGSEAPNDVMETINFSTTPELKDSSRGSPSGFFSNSDVIDRGIVSREAAYRLFQSYNDNLVQHYPCVVFSADFTAEDCRRTKPILFLAVIAAAAGQINPSLYSILNAEVLTAYAYRTVICHEKSLELVQALIVTAVWYYPPGKFAQLKFYEYIHMAATMAVDLGMGKNPKSSRSRRGGGGGTSPETLDDEEIEKRRIFLVCYMITTGVSTSMRRPNMLRYNSWLHECLETIQNNPKITKLDRSLICWVKLLKITEDIAISFSFDDISNMPDLSESRVQILMNGFEKELERWKSQSELNDALVLQYCHTQLYLHEVALHDDHPPEDFIPPLKLSKILAINTLPEASSTFLEASAVSITSAQTLLDTIINMDLDSLRALPIVNFVRTCYSLVSLIKLYISSKSPTSKIGSVLDSKSLKLDYYLSTVTEKLIDGVGLEEYRAPYTFLGIIMRFKIWYEGQKDAEYFEAPNNLTPSMDGCWLPPVPNNVWEKYFGKPSDESYISWQQKTSTESHDVGTDQNHLELLNLSDNINTKISVLTNLDQFDTIHQAEFDYTEQDFEFDESLLMNDLQFDIAQEGWVPSMDIPGMYGSAEPLAMFQWGTPGASNTPL